MIKLVLTAAAKDKKVIDPATGKKILPIGVHVRKVDSYWKKRINDGDVEIEKTKKKEK